MAVYNMSNFESLLKEFKHKKYNGTYVFYGDEPFFVDQLTEIALENCIEPSEKDFCQKVFYGKDSNFHDIRNYCLKSPMSFSANPKQLVVVKEAQAITKDYDVIAKYIESPNPITTLILVFRDTKLNKAIPKQATFFKSEKLHVTKELPKWIRDQFATNELKVTDTAVRQIVEFLGNNLENISNEIQKLSLGVKDKSKDITEQDIFKNFGLLKEFTPFELNDALGDKNALKTFKIITYLSKNPKLMPAEVIISNLYTFFMLLYKIKLAKRMRLDDAAIADKLRMPSWMINKNSSFVMKYSIEQLENALITVSSFDKRNKGISDSQLEYDQFLKELCLRLMA
jgi:DNA polymerase-3 subunit delta